MDNSSLSEAKTRSFFKGNEFIVTGKLLDERPFGIQINGSGTKKFFRNLTICLRSADQKIDDEGLTKFSPNTTCLGLEPPVYPKSESQNFLKKLYAFTNIKQLLNKIKVTSNETEQEALEEKATSLALENNLVTDLTSLVVVKPDADPVINQLTTEVRRRPIALSSAHFSAGGGFQSFNSLRTTSFSSGFGGLSGTGVSAGRPLGGTGVSSRVSNGPLGGTGVSFENLSGSSGHFSRRRTPPRPTTTTTTTTVTVTTSTTKGPLLITSESTIILDEFFDDSTNSTDQVLSTEEVPTDSCIGTLTLFSKTYNRGEEIEITEDTEDLEGFDNKAVTAALTGNCCWRIFSKTDFSGSEKTLRPGETYTGASSLGRELFRNVSSVRKESC